MTPSSSNNTVASTAMPFARPLYVMLKPVGAACNLHCRYCYYLEKKHLYTASTQRVLTEEMLETFVREYIEAQTTDHVLFTWHGGEPLMRPLSFYRKAMELQRRYARGRVVENSLQTNGTLLTEEWCQFLAENGWLVGISIDGPQDVHDAYRRSRMGRPSWAQVMRGIQLLQRYGVEWNAMAVVHRDNADDPLRFYHFFKEIGCRYLQFAPIVEREAPHSNGRHLASLADDDNCPVTSWSVTPQQWGQFLITIFDEWVRHDVGQMYVEIFDCMLANWVGVTPGICIFAKECGHAGVMEHNGDVYSCDHFVFPEYRLGNIREKTLVEMLYGPQQQQFSQLKYHSLTQQCKECRFEFACHGECPKNRFTTDRYGHPGHNYLCAGYYAFLSHIAPYMDFMRDALKEQRPPAGIMDALRSGAFRP